MNLFEVIKRPIITEKSMQLVARHWYTFEVDKQASKNSIAQAIQEFFKVDVLKIRTVKIAAKKRRFGKKRLVSLTGASKKALVQIKADQKIDLFEMEGKK